MLQTPAIGPWRRPSDTFGQIKLHHGHRTDALIIIAFQRTTSDLPEMPKLTTPGTGETSRPRDLATCRWRHSHSWLPGALDQALCHTSEWGPVTVCEHCELLMLNKSLIWLRCLLANRACGAFTPGANHTTSSMRSGSSSWPGVLGLFSSLVHGAPCVVGYRL